MHQHADAVRQERLLRGWSVREASTHGGISNTYWGNFEDYKQPLTPYIVEGVARAFGWPLDWADQFSPLAEIPEDVAERFARQMLRMSRQLEELAGRLAALEVELRLRGGNSSAP